MTCLDLHWVVFRPSKKTNPRLHTFFVKTHCGIANVFAFWIPQCVFSKNVCNLGSVFFEGLKMAQWRSKHVALTVDYFNVYEINCCVIDWHVCIFCLFLNAFTAGWHLFGSCMSWQVCRELCFLFCHTEEAVGDLVWLYVGRGWLYRELTCWITWQAKQCSGHRNKRKRSYEVAFVRFMWVGKCMCPCVSQYIFSSTDRCIWIKTRNSDYKRAKRRCLGRHVDPGRMVWVI